MKKTFKGKRVENKLIRELVEFCVKERFVDYIKIRKRCLLEGCVYGHEGYDKEPKDECIYCGEPRPFVERYADFVFKNSKKK